MAIEEQLAADLTAAMKARDQQVVDALRSAKAKVVERQKAPGFTGPMTDRVAAEAIGAYVKGLKKAIEEIERGGGGDNPIIAKYRFECELLARYLPKTMSEDDTRALVRATIAELGVSGPSAVGRVMGAIMKTRRDEVDSTLVKRVVEEELAKAP
jgi:uncharacterized protein YqeY